MSTGGSDWVGMPVASTITSPGASPTASSGTAGKVTVASGFWLNDTKAQSAKLKPTASRMRSSEARRFDMRRYFPSSSIGTRSSPASMLRRRASVR